MAWEYLRTTLSGSSDSNFCVIAALIWVVVNASKETVTSGPTEGEETGLENDRDSYLHL